jgi:NAD(P)H-hydrate epimerase
VLDADGLTCFEGDAETLFTAIKNKPKGVVVLTPHAGEFQRLFQLKGAKIVQAQEAAKLSGAILVFKGNDTIIANPTGEVIINDSAPPYLAKAGTGDVLAGLIGGLLAQRCLPPLEAVAQAVFIHGRLGHLAGEHLIASDLPKRIPAILGENTAPMRAFRADERGWI